MSQVTRAIRSGHQFFSRSTVFASPTLKVAVSRARGASSEARGTDVSNPLLFGDVIGQAGLELRADETPPAQHARLELVVAKLLVHRNGDTVQRGQCRDIDMPPRVTEGRLDFRSPVRKQQRAFRRKCRFQGSFRFLLGGGHLPRR